MEAALHLGSTSKHNSGSRMYAVIESGGKQYRVHLGAEIQVDHLEFDAGASVTFDRVLLVADGDTAAIGQPHVDGAVVNASVVNHDRGEKVVVFKYRPKARRRVKKGFRAALTTLRISDITYGGQSAAQAAAREQAEREQAESAAREAAERKAATDQALASKLAAELETSTPAEGAAVDAPSGKAGARTRRARAAADTGTAEAAAEAAPAEAPGAAEADAPGERTGPEAASSAADSEPAAGAADEATGTPDGEVGRAASDSSRKDG